MTHHTHEGRTVHLLRGAEQPASSIASVSINCQQTVARRSYRFCEMPGCHEVRVRELSFRRTVLPANFSFGKMPAFSYALPSMRAP